MPFPTTPAEKQERADLEQLAKRAADLERDAYRAVKAHAALDARQGGRHGPQLIVVRRKLKEAASLLQDVVKANSDTR